MLADFSNRQEDFILKSIAQQIRIFSAADKTRLRTKALGLVQHDLGWLELGLKQIFVLCVAVVS